MKRFAFDLGTQSIGWCVLDFTNEHVKLIDLGTRIFPDGREPGKNGRMGDPLNLSRRMARQLRRNLERRKRRKAAMFRFLSTNGYIPKGDALGPWKESDPYKLRSEALERPLTAFELARVLMNLATRRGFKSNRKTDSQDKESKGLALRQAQLREKLNGKTLGQYLHEVHSIPGSRIRFRSDSPFFPTRAMYEEEFSRIRQKQESYHPGFDWARAYRIIFFQRPLKRPDRAACPFYQDEKRGYKAQPSAQAFRILQDIVNLAYRSHNGKYISLTSEQKNYLYNQLCSKNKMPFDQLRSIWDIDGPFNLEGGTLVDLKGNATDIFMRKVIGGAWDSLDVQARDDLVEFLIIEEDDEKIRNKLRCLGVEPNAIDLVLHHDFPVGTTSVSARFMRDVCAIMKRDWCSYDEAVLKLGMHHSDFGEPEKFMRLPYYGEVLRYTTVPIAKNRYSTEEVRKNPELQFGRIPNPTVHIALNQLRKLTNCLIDRYGAPDEVVLELATELKKGRDALDRIIRKQKENSKKNDRIRGELRALLGKGEEYYPSKADIRKYILWEELGENQTSRSCIYCGRPIGASQLLNGEAEVEHIIPFSKSLDDSMANLTVAHRACNVAKGNLAPYEAFGNNPPGYSWSEIASRAERLRDRRKRDRFAPDAMEKWGETSDFIASQLTDTAYIAKAASYYMASICPRNKIWTIPGQLTAIFRKQWGLDAILSSVPGKNRSDHRHHALDAIAIGLTDRGLLQDAARCNSASAGGKIVAPPFPLDRHDVIEALRNMLVSIKPDHGKSGPLFAETAYGYTDEPKDPINSSASNSTYWVRKPVRSLTCSEIADRIIDKRIASRIADYLATNRIDIEKKGANIDNKQIEKALIEFETESGIHRVRIHPKNEEGYRRLDKGIGGRTGRKAYQYSDVLCVDIWMQRKAKGKINYYPDYFYRAEVPIDSEEPIPRRPSAEAKRLMRLYKNDVIRIKRDNVDVYARIAGFAVTRDKIDLQPLFASGSIEQWLTQTNPAFTDKFWNPKGAQNHIAVNTIFQRKNPTDRVSKVAISIDGKVRRRY